MAGSREILCGVVGTGAVVVVVGVVVVIVVVGGGVVGCVIVVCGGDGGGGDVIPEEVTLRLAPDPAFVRLASREGFDISRDVSAVMLPPTEAIR